MKKIKDVFREMTKRQEFIANHCDPLEFYQWEKDGEIRYNWSYCGDCSERWAMWFPSISDTLQAWEETEIQSLKDYLTTAVEDDPEREYLAEIMKIKN